MLVVTCEKARQLVVAGRVPIVLESQVAHYGLAGILLARCQGCKLKVHMETSPKLKTDRTRHYDINDRAVWGSIVSGNGLAHLNEQLASMDSPTMLQVNQLQSDLKRFDRNIYLPILNIIVQTITPSKSLNEYLGTTPKQHQCFKNLNQSSQTMESDIIVEGFLKANSHGVRYMHFIADGDSSMHAQIMDRVPVCDKHVKKLECANHITKCLRSNLENLVAENPSYKGKGKLCNRTRVRIDQNEDDDNEIESEDIFQEQYEFWDAGTSLQTQEDSRVVPTERAVSGKQQKSKDKKEIRERRWKRKMSSLKESNSIKAKQHYGNESIQPESDVLEDELTKLKYKFLQNNIEIRTSEIIQIEKDTKMQVCSEKLKNERKKGLQLQIFKRKPSIKVTPLVLQLLYSNFKEINPLQLACVRNELPFKNIFI
ncbi:unnamed protein product [Mytilus coruscus]|uniref:Mutator-like transposase domain-containing protein n=1 Tax=Mytilus coruscus TaxID=42192 RepID=A0A6J8BY98_MYTCO|nr:unnamed protein product [Mytilus coruscus]